jgi:AAA ATPase domain
MSANPIPINFGKIDPANLIGRDRTIERCWTRLEQGSSLLVTGERRIGKSSIAQTLDLRPRDGWVVVYLNVEAITTIDDLVRSLVTKLQGEQRLDRKVKKAIGGLLDRVSAIKIAGSGIEVRQRSEGAAYEVLGELIEKISQSAKLLLILDELPILAQTLAKNSVDDALLLLRTLRSLRATYPNHRQLLCGSIGFHHLLADATEIKAAVNDLITVPVEALDPKDAAELAIGLLLGIGREVPPTDPIIKAIVEATDGIPFYEHHLVAALDDQNSLTLDAVAQARRRGIAGADDPWKTEHYVNRIGDYFGAKAAEASAILDAVASNGDSGISVDELTNVLAISLGQSMDRQELLRLIDRLRLDHYVDFDDSDVSDGGSQTLRFCFRIVRDSWIARRNR